MTRSMVLGQLWLLVIIYKEKIPLRLAMDGDSSQIDFLFTKKPEWKYEKEVRILVKPPGLQPFSPELLNSIMLGKNIGEQSRAQILEWVTRRALPLNVLQASFNSELQAMEYITIGSRST